VYHCGIDSWLLHKGHEEDTKFHKGFFDADLYDFI
jgi:hypothetical protein